MTCGLTWSNYPTCSALDHVELIRIRGDHFRKLVEAFPELRDSLLEKATQILNSDDEARDRLQAVHADDFLEQGLFLAQSLLVLDLERFLTDSLPADMELPEEFDADFRARFDSAFLASGTACSAAGELHGGTRPVTPIRPR